MNNNIRTLLEAFDDIEYDRSKAGTAAKAGVVTAKLKSHDSGVYTKLAQKVQRISDLKAEISALEEEVKQSTRDDIAALFTAEDAVNRRIVETVSFTLSLAPQPKPTKSVQYAKVLEKLTESLTPELILVLEGLKKEFESVVQKSPILKVEKKPVSEGVSDVLKNHFSKFLSVIKKWGSDYDRKLAKLKAEVERA